MWRRCRFWTVGLSVAAHGIVIAVILTQFGKEPSGAESTASSPIEVALAPEVGLQSAAADTVETVKAQTVPLQAVRPPEPVTVQPETIVPLEQIDAAKMVAPHDANPVTEPPPPPKPKPARHEVAKVRQPVETKVAPPDVAAVSEVAPSTAAADQRSGSDTRHDAAARDSSPGGSALAGQADYMAVIRAWLEKHKEYPRQARMRRQEGTAFLYFEMDRDGQVRNFRVTLSSGHQLLDREVEEMIQRATPLPPMPPEMTAARLELVVPVRFHLR